MQFLSPIKNALTEVLDLHILRCVSVPEVATDLGLLVMIAITIGWVSHGVVPYRGVVLYFHPVSSFFLCSIVLHF